MPQRAIVFVLSEYGYTWDEAILPYVEFDNVSFRIQVATPNGKLPTVDPLSTRVRPILNLVGFGTAKDHGPESAIGRKFLKVLEQPISLTEIDPGTFDALYIAGGHGALFDLNKSAVLHRLILTFDRDGKCIGVICHAASTLAFVRKDHASFLENRKVTGFPTLWEHAVLLTNFISPRFLPLPLWTGKEIDKYATRRTIWTRIREAIDPGYTVVDRNLVSGVGPKAARNVARRMLALIL